ncbi:unnamed protein product [Paramecium octaurelia]|uniref:Uncharacterized protein n=1 Tax=Paramecium octaurelia TaxID=43137 RepID=A0A8S1XBL0_PAROT|nr:unnamed protein product [Paramecium octaurelia]
MVLFRYDKGKIEEPSVLKTTTLSKFVTEFMLRKLFRFQFQFLYNTWAKAYIKFHCILQGQLRVELRYKNREIRQISLKYKIIDNLSPILSQKKSDTYYINENAVLSCYTSAHQIELIEKNFDAFVFRGDVYILMKQMQYIIQSSIKQRRSESFNQNYSHPNIFNIKYKNLWTNKKKLWKKLTKHLFEDCINEIGWNYITIYQSFYTWMWCYSLRFNEKLLSMYLQQSRGSLKLDGQQVWDQLSPLILNLRYWSILSQDPRFLEQFKAGVLVMVPFEILTKIIILLLKLKNLSQYFQYNYFDVKYYQNIIYCLKQTLKLGLQQLLDSFVQTDLKLNNLNILDLNSLLKYNSSNQYYHNPIINFLLIMKIFKIF